MADYPGTPVAKETDQHVVVPPLNYSQHLFNNVKKVFVDLPVSGDYIRIDPDKTFSNTDAYSAFSIKKFIEKRRLTHFQGVARTRDGRHVIISGGDKKKKCGQLFIIKLNNYLSKTPASKVDTKKKQAIGSNVIFDQKPPKEDKLVKVIKISEGEYWHVGGISILGNVLIVPIEKDNLPDKPDGTTIYSKIKFYNIEDPLNPVELNVSIEDIANKAGAVSMIRLKSGKFLVAVWTDSNKHDGKQGSLSFFLSKSNNLRDGFLVNGKYQMTRWPYDAIHEKNSSYPRLQAIQLLMQDDHKLFMMGMDNKAMLSPIINRKNRAILFGISFVGEDFADDQFKITTGDIDIVSFNGVKFIKEFLFDNNQYNFDAGCGIYTTPEGELALYSTHHWRHNGFINLMECYTNQSNQVINHIGDACIFLYSDSDFKGKVMRILGDRFSNIPDYDNIFVCGDGYSDKTKSLKYKLPIGTQYWLYEDKQFNGGDLNKNILVLEGKGTWVNISDLSKIKSTDSTKGYLLHYPDRSFKCKVSSSKFI